MWTIVLDVMRFVEQLKGRKSEGKVIMVIGKWSDVGGSGL